MKKIILSLFLVLVASSYAVPNFVNSKRAEERGYKVVQDTEGTLSIQKVDDFLLVWSKRSRCCRIK